MGKTTLWGLALLATLATTASADSLTELTRTTAPHSDASTLPLATACDLSLQPRGDLDESQLVALTSIESSSLCTPPASTAGLPAMPGLTPDAARMHPGLTPPAERMLPGLSPQGERMLPPTGLPALQPSKRMDDLSGLLLGD
jgi:hypothetical protein